MSYILVRKSVWRSSESRVGLPSKRQIRFTLSLFEIYDHVSKGKDQTFKLFEKSSLVQIRRKIWTKLAFSKITPARDSNYSKLASLVQIFLQICTKLAFSNNLNADQTCLLKRDHKFRREIKWTKLTFSKQVQHVILNSFKHFFGPKYKTLGSHRIFMESFRRFIESHSKLSCVCLHLLNL